MRHLAGSVVVALFALVFLHAAWAVRLSNPLFRRYLAAGLPGGPNVLLTTRGRSSGRPLPTPVAMLRIGDRRFVQAASGDVGWVRNLRAAAAATVTEGHRTYGVEAAELAPEAAGVMMRDALAPYRRSRLVRAVVGPATRPPIGVLRFFGIRVDHALDAYVAIARSQPVFELRPSATWDRSSAGADQALAGRRRPRAG